MRSDRPVLLLNACHPERRRRSVPLGENKEGGHGGRLPVRLRFAED